MEDRSSPAKAAKNIGWPLMYLSAAGELEWINEAAGALPPDTLSWARNCADGPDNTSPDTMTSPEGRTWRRRIFPGDGGASIVLLEDVHEGISDPGQTEISAIEYKLLVESAEAILWKYDIPSDTWSYVSPQTKSILGYAPEEWTGLAFWANNIHSEDREWATLYCQECTALGQAHTFEYRFLAKSGRVVWLRDVVSVEMGDDGPTALRGFMIDITDRKMAEQRLETLSFKDQLTGLYNRRFFEEEITRLDVARQLPLSIVMIDVNGLKLVNDTLGHARGDDVLRRVASTLRASFRDEDILARWGGDEFVALLPATDAQTAETICERILGIFQEAYLGDEGIPISVALGTAVKEEEHQNIGDVLRESEDWMYKNKLAISTSARSAVLRAFLNSLGAKSHETEEHTRRMQVSAREMGERIGLSSSEINRLSLLVSLHDIGKIAISEGILKKAGPLTPEEWRVMRRHPEVGYRIASATDEFASVAREILHHHERWDGSGYPSGLKSESIPLLSRIAAIVDAYEAMTSDRPYRKALPPEESLDQIRAAAGGQFDPHLCTVFLDLVEEGRIRRAE